MKTIRWTIVLLTAVTVTSCGSIGTGNGTGSYGDLLGNVIGAVTNPQTAGNILKSVIGLDRPKEQQLIGQWTYKQPGVAFTSENLLAKAGGEVAATEAKNKLASYYSTLNIKSGNTLISLKDDKTFSAKIAGKSLSGTYTFDEKKSLLTLKTLLFSLPCYVKSTTTGMSFLFESKKLLTLLQTVATLSGNSSLQTIGDLSKNYDGIRLGFDMKK